MTLFVQKISMFKVKNKTTFWNKLSQSIVYKPQILGVRRPRKMVSKLTKNAYTMIQLLLKINQNVLSFSKANVLNQLHKVR